MFDARHAERGVYCTQPKNAFVKRDLNAIKHADGSRNVALEGRFSALEGDVKFVLDKIITAARARQLPGLSRREREVWDLFTYFQYKRAPDVYERIGVLADFESTVMSTLQEIEGQLGRQLTEFERAPLTCPQSIDRIKHNSMVVARGRIPPEMFGALSSRGIAIGLISRPDKCFIVGDHPHIRTQGIDLNDDRQEFWLPISSDVAVSPGGRTSVEQFVSIGRKHVHTFNKWIARNSNVIGARSKALVHNLSGIVGSASKVMH